MSGSCPGCGAERFKAFSGRGGLHLERCLGCRSVRLDPVRHACQPDEIYQSAYFEPWNMVPDSPEWKLREQTAELRLDALERLGARGRLLDVGCAGGYLVASAVARGFDARGVEISQHAAEVAQRVAPGRVTQGQLETCAIEPASLDVLTLFDVLEHHPEPPALLAHAAGLLAPGGLLALTVPDADSLTACMMGPIWPHYKEEHLFYPSRRALRALLDAAGFEIRLEERARKCLSLGFMLPLLERYPVPGLTPLFGAVTRAVPEGLQERAFRVSIGERLMIGRKRQAEDPGRG